jgi:hypothetical protein
VKIFKKDSTSYGSNLDLIISKLSQGEDFQIDDFDRSKDLNDIKPLLMMKMGSAKSWRISSVNIKSTPKKMTFKQIGELLKANLNVMNQAKKGDIIRKEIDTLHVRFFYHDYILIGKRCDVSKVVVLTGIEINRKIRGIPSDFPEFSKI